MSEYKLYIQALNGIWYIADMGDDKPAMNYQVNNIAELKDRQCDYSQSLKLPFSQINDIIFACSNQIDVVTDTPYTKLNCRLFSGESLIAGNGSYLILDKSTTHYEVQILSGNNDFFDKLKSQKLNELDLGYYIIGSKNIHSNYSNDNYCVPASYFVSNDQYSYNISTDHAYPFAWLKNAIEKIITSNGYTLQTNLLDTDWNKKAINICQKKASYQSLSPFNCEFSAGFTGGTGAVQLIINSNEANNAIVDATTLYVPINSNCEATVTYEISFLDTIDPKQGSIVVKVELFDYDTGIVLIDENIIDVSDIPTSRSVDFTIVSNTNTAVYISVYKNNVTANLEMSIGGSVNFLANDTSIIIDKSKLFISDNLGFDTQFDLFKAFAQLYGLTIIIDNDLKKVFAFTMDMLYLNKSKAKDWSSKVSSKSNEMSFSINSYAQKNTIKFDDYNQITDKAVFTVNNQAIDDEAELFSIKFEAGINLNKIYGPLNKQLAHIPIEEYDSSDDTIKFIGGKPHIVDISTVRVSTVPIVNAMIATHTRIETYINKYYDKLISKMLVSSKIIENEFILTDDDILEYKSSIDNMPGSFIPVYISHLGQYFYINKIKNFVSGELTKCELVRL